MEIRTYLLNLFIVTLVDIILHVHGSGSLYDPPNRAVMWKYGFHTQKNYNYMQLNCGGIKQNEIGDFRCGVCGDPYNSTRPHEKKGRYGTGMISRYYPGGIKEMPVKVELLAYEKGFFEFRMCSADNNNEVTQACLDDNILPIKEGYLSGTPLRFYPQGAGDFRLTVAVPPNMTCDRCVLQWRYHTANSWGTDPVTKEQGLGMGPQEEFRNCADVRIGGAIPNSVRDNPFFAPPDARPASAIDKPTDQKKRLSSRQKTVSVTSGNIQSTSVDTHGTFGVGKASASSKKRMQIPDVRHGGKTVSNVQTSSVKRQGMSKLMPVISGTALSSGVKQESGSVKQIGLNQNDINAKQVTGLLSMDNVLQDTSKRKHSKQLATSSGTADLIGHRKDIGSMTLQGFGSQMVKGLELTEGMDMQMMNSVGMAHNTRQETGSTGGTIKRMSQGIGSNLGMDSPMTGQSESSGGVGSQIIQNLDSAGTGSIRKTQGTGFIVGMDGHMTGQSESTGGVVNQIKQHTDSVGTGVIQERGIGPIKRSDGNLSGATRFTGGSGGHALNVGTMDSFSSGMTNTGRNTFDSVNPGRADVNAFTDGKMSIQSQGGNVLSGMSTDQILRLIDQAQISQSRGIGGHLVGNSDGHISVGQIGSVGGKSSSQISDKKSIRGQVTRHTADKVPNSGTQFRIEKKSMIGGIRSQTSPGQDNIGSSASSGLLDSSANNLLADSMLPIVSAGQEIGSVERTLNIKNQADIIGAVGPAPKPEKKSSLLIEGTRISKQTSESNTGKMKAATRSGLALTGDRTVSNDLNAGARQLDNNLQQASKSAFVRDGMVVGQTGNANRIGSGGIERSMSFGNEFTDLTVDGTQSNTITDKINTGLETRFAAQNVDRNMQSGISSGTSGELFSGNTGASGSLKGSHLDGKISETRQGLELIQSGKRDILSSGNDQTLSIPSLQHNSNRQRIFLVRANRPNAVLLSNSADGSNVGMTISESLQPDTGIVRTSSGKASSITGTGQTSPNNAAMKLSTSKRHETASSVHSIPDVGMSDRNPSSKEGLAATGPAVDLIQSGVIDPFRTQMIRSDGRIAGEHMLEPSGNTGAIKENLGAPPGHSSTKTKETVINDIDAFRNVLVKDSLIQGGALPAAQAALKTNTHTDIAAKQAINTKSADSGNIAGTNILASNEIGGKTGATSLDQTVSDLLIEAQRILSSTADITNAQTATDTASARAVVSAAAFDAASQKTKDHSHAKPAVAPAMHKGHVDKQKTIPTLSLEYLLEKPANSLEGTRTGPLKTFVDGAHGQHEVAMPEGRHGISNVGADVLKHSAGFHSNMVTTDKISNQLKPDTFPAGTGTRPNDAPLSIAGVNTNERSFHNMGHTNNEQLPSHSSAHGAGTVVDAQASLLSNLDILGPETGIIFKTPSIRGASNVNARNTGTESLAGTVPDIGMNTVFADTQLPDLASLRMAGRAGVANKVDQNTAIRENSISSSGSTASQISGQNRILGGGSDFAHVGTVKSQHSDQSGSNFIGSLLDGTAMTDTFGVKSANMGSSLDVGGVTRLGGNVIDFRASTAGSKQPSDSKGLTQSQGPTDLANVNLLSPRRTLSHRHGIIPDTIVGSRGDLTSTPLGSSPLGTSENVNKESTLSSSHERVDQTVSSSSQRRRIIGRSNRIPIAASTRTDGGNIEQQLNALNLDSIPSGAVVGAGIQMTADGRLTTGFGPRGRDMPRERLISERRLMSRGNSLAEVPRSNAVERTSGSRSGGSRMVRDPRTGMQARLPTGERRSGRSREMSRGSTRVQDGHSHRSETASNPIYFLDMSGSTSSDTRMTDRTNVRGRPLLERESSSSSERRLMRLRDRSRRIDRAGAGSETRSRGSSSSRDSSVRIRDGDFRRRTGANRESAGFEIRRGGSVSTVDPSARVRGRNTRTDTRRRTGAERGSAGFDIRIGGARSTSGSGASFRESELRSDSRRRMETDRESTGITTRMRDLGSSSDTERRFREGRLRGDSRRRMGSRRGVEGFDMRIGRSGSTSSSGSLFREGDLRADTGRRRDRDRSGAPSDIGMDLSRSSGGGDFGFRDVRFGRDSSRLIDGELRGTRRDSFGRDGGLRSFRDEAAGGGRMSSSLRPRGQIGVPFGAPMASTRDSLGAMSSVSGFPPGMPSFDGPFMRPMGPGSIMDSSVSMSGMPTFDGGFGPMSVSPDFGPSFGPGMGSPGMGSDIGMPPFSPMDFVPGIL